MNPFPVLLALRLLQPSVGSLANAIVDLRFVTRCSVILLQPMRTIPLQERLLDLLLFFATRCMRSGSGTISINSRLFNPNEGAILNSVFLSSIYLQGWGQVEIKHTADKGNSYQSYSASMSVLFLLTIQNAAALFTTIDFSWTKEITGWNELTSIH